MSNKKLPYLNDSLDNTVQRILGDKIINTSNLKPKDIKKTLYSFGGDEIATLVYYKKYALKDGDNNYLEFTLNDTLNRCAKAIANVESSFNKDVDLINHTKYFRELYGYMLPAGRQLFALGNKFVPNATLANCYFKSIEEDSIEGIFDCGKNCAITYSYGGGIGIDISCLRPRGSKVSNSSGISTGAASFMPFFSQVTGIIGQNGRRGALMISMDVDHPDIEEFINIKSSDLDSVRYANISVRLTDEFMNAVDNDDEFTLIFKTKHEVIEKIVSAKELWNKMISAAHKSAEPGLQFIDTVKRFSTSEIYNRLKIKGSNPCSEIFMEDDGSCILASMLLTRFVKHPYTSNAYFDRSLFVKMVIKGVEHLDNVVELNIKKHPLYEQQEAARLGRRIGLGLTGLADTLTMLGMRYGSSNSFEFIRDIANLKMNTEYIASIQLAKRRGMFPLCEPSNHFKQLFCEGLHQEVIESGKKYGIRNVSVSTVAPSGTLSIMAQCSSGIEPIYALSYNRTVAMGGEEKVIKINHHGVIDYFNKNPEAKKLPYCFITSHDVDSVKRVEVQSELQKCTDSAISSTINLPASATVHDVSNIYMNAWKSGLKGVTVYRDGSREGILTTDKDESTIIEDKLTKDTVVKCLSAEGGNKFYVLISYKDKDNKLPYQIFILNYKKVEKDSFIKISNELGTVLKENGVDEERIKKYSDRSTDSLSKLTRFLSLSMKTNNLSKAMIVLNKYAFVGTLASKLCNILNQTLDKQALICHDCSSSNIRLEEGCYKCIDCGWSKCN